MHSFCKKAVDLNKVKPSTLDKNLLEGTLQMFPIFEKVEGVTFSKFLKTKANRRKNIKAMALQILLALDSLNRVNQIYTHNDLHLNNIMVSQTSIADYNYLGSDSQVRTVATNGVRMMIIDQGMACVGKGNTLGQFSRPFCPAVDVFKVLTDLWRTLRKDWLKVVIKILFGKEVFRFLTSKKVGHHSFYNYASYLFRKMRKLSLVKSLSVTYLQAIGLIQSIKTKPLKRV